MAGWRGYDVIVAAEEFDGYPQWGKVVEERGDQTVVQFWNDHYGTREVRSDLVYRVKGEWTDDIEGYYWRKDQEVAAERLAKEVLGHRGPLQQRTYID